MSTALERARLLIAVAPLAGCSAPHPTEGEGPPGHERPTAALPGAVLEDQNGGLWAIRDVLAGPGFIIIGGASASDRSTRWDIEVIEPLAARLGWSVHRVLCLARYPHLFRSAVVSRVRASARPAGAPILLDWEDRISHLLACGAEDTTIIVVDRGGRELGRVGGDPDSSRGAVLERIAGAATGEGAGRNSP